MNSDKLQALGLLAVLVTVGLILDPAIVVGFSLMIGTVLAMCLPFAVIYAIIQHREGKRK